MADPLENDEEHADDLTRYLDMLPEGAMPLYGLRIICYLNSEGTTMHHWLKDGPVRLGEMVGAIEVAKHRMIDSINEEEDA